MGADPVLGVVFHDPPRVGPLPGPEPPPVPEVVAVEMEGTTPETVVEATDLLSTLFDAHYRSLCRLAYVLLGDGAQAEDVVQEAFLRTFTGFGRLRDRGRADAYLRRSVVNLSRSRLRRRTTEGRSNAAAHRSEQFEDLSGRHDLDLLEAVRALPPRQRATVVLFYYADLPETEVAATLGCSAGTVKSQLAKARATLARSLGADPEGGTP
jgi:RNA polymerase sigma-70 factor (sigma-E family)